MYSTQKVLIDRCGQESYINKFLSQVPGLHPANPDYNLYNVKIMDTAVETGGALMLQALAFQSRNGLAFITMKFDKKLFSTAIKYGQCANLIDITEWVGIDDDTRIFIVPSPIALKILHKTFENIQLQRFHEDADLRKVVMDLDATGEEYSSHF